jgi:hypothetical protein
MSHAEHGFWIPDGWDDFFGQRKVEIVLQTIWNQLDGGNWLPKQGRVFAFLKGLSLI